MHTRRATSREVVIEAERMASIGRALRDARELMRPKGFNMPTLDDVYRKFGETAEAAQLLETDLGTKLILIRGAEENLLTEPNPERASDIFDTINRNTLGQLLKGLNGKNQSLDALEALLSNALQERNRLFHSFYRHHNFRRNSDEGRALMLKDMESIHDTLLRAWKAVMLLSGVDLDALVNSGVEHTPPTRHVPI
jgi:hypothetical protein